LNVAHWQQQIENQSPAMSKITKYLSGPSNLLLFFPVVVRLTVFFYNFGWVDMTVPTLELMMRVVQVISFTVVEKRRKACCAYLHVCAFRVESQNINGSMFYVLDSVLCSLVTENRLEHVRMSTYSV
jgi:hypothetical protein